MIPIPLEQILTLLASSTFIKYVKDHVVSNKIDELLKKSKRKKDLNHQMVCVLDKSLERFCKEVNWEYDDTAIEQTFSRDISELAQIDSVNILKDILKNATGQEIDDTYLKIWQTCFNYEISEPEYDKLCKILNIEDIEILKKKIIELQEKVEKDTSRQNQIDIQDGVSSNFCGRKKELNWIKKEFEKTNIVLLVGDGGIGKTSIARKYYHNNKNLYGRAHLIDASCGIRGAIAGIKFSVDFKGTEDELYEKKRALLSGYDEKTLIVLDNCDVDVELDDFADLEMKCKFIVTSRCGNSYYPHSLKIGPLSKAGMLSLVRKTYPGIFSDNSQNEREVKESLYSFFEYTEGNTLIIELAAALMNEGNIKLSDIRDRLLKDNGSVKLPYKKRDKAFNILAAIYDYAHVNKEQEKILCAVCMIAPGIGIEREKLTELLGLKNFDELNSLVRKHFFRENERKITMHPVFSDVFYSLKRVYAKKSISIKSINYIVSNLFEHNDIPSVADRLNCINYVEANRFEIFSEDPVGKLALANMRKEQGYCYSELGYNTKACKYLDEALKLYTELGDSKNIADTYNNLGVVNSELGKHHGGESAKCYFDKALEFKLKALKIYKSLYKDDPSNIKLARIYNNIGATYDDMAKRASSPHEKENFLETAIDYKQHSLKIREELCRRSGIYENVSVALCCSSLGVTYRIMDMHSQSLEYHKRAIKILEREISNKENLSWLALAYNNIAETYSNLNMDTCSLEYYEKASRIYEDIYSDYPNHPDLKMIYKNMVSIYEKLGNSEADTYRQKLSDMPSEEDELQYT